jgi:hypothetical protein
VVLSTVILHLFIYLSFSMENRPGIQRLAVRRLACCADLASDSLYFTKEHTNEDPARRPDPLQQRVERRFSFQNCFFLFGLTQDQARTSETKQRGNQ